MTTQLVGSGVQAARLEYRNVIRQYERIRDCLAGQDRIKDRTTVYLPRPNAADGSRENQERYKAYIERAIFYNVAQPTVSGMVGQIFAREPVAELPTRLDVLTQDAAGEGLTLTQLAKRACRHTLSYGRAGIWTDYPTGGAVSVAQVASGEVRPIVTVYDALNILNWREILVNGRKVLTMVVLREYYDDTTDEFSIRRKQQYRVLRIRDGVYTVQVYRDGVPTGGEIVPRNAAGRPFTRIPFTFVGSENNDSEIDVPPMAAIANLNIGHYRNSADYEESVFVVGQPTVFVSGLTEDWLTNQLDGVIRFGSRGGVPLPPDGRAELIQMQPNSAAFEAMDKKERQMVALGAKLVEQRTVQRTAFETGVETASETSVLQDVANNVSAAITFALRQAAEFTGDAPDTIEYSLNDEFDLAMMTPEERTQVIQSWLDGAISFGEMRANLRKSGTATLDEDEARRLIDQEADERARRAQEAAAAATPDDDATDDADDE
jgi:hypothetical protein